MFASFQKKYFLSDKGVAGVKRGIFWTALTNLITMAGMGFLFLVMAGFVEHLATGADLPDALPIVGGLLVFFVLLFASNWQQYYYTYCIFYEEWIRYFLLVLSRYFHYYRVEYFLSRIFCFLFGISRWRERQIR